MRECALEREKRETEEKRENKREKKNPHANKLLKMVPIRDQNRGRSRTGACGGGEGGSIARGRLITREIFISTIHIVHNIDARTYIPGLVPIKEL